MLIYLILFLILLFGVFHYDFKRNKFLETPYYFFLFLFFTLMTGLRYRVGGDALLYDNVFFIFPDLDGYFYYIEKENYLNYQPLWLLFVAVCKSIDPDYYFYQFIHSIIFNIIIFWFIRKYSFKPYTVLLLLFLFLFYFYYGFEIQREIFAICCFLLAYKSFLNNKWFHYYILATIAFFFHVSASILFILPLFKLIKFNSKFIIIALLLSVPAIIGKAFFYDFLSSLLVTESMQERGKTYSEVDFSIAGILFFYFIRVIVFIPFLIYYAKNKKNNISDWLFSAFLILSILSQAMVGFDRLLNYVYIPFIFCFVDFIYNKPISLHFFQRKAIVFSTHIGLFCVLAVKILIANYGNSYYFSVFFPYGSVFEKEKDHGREQYLIELWK